MKMKDQRLYAFWKYDQFPYVLGGEIGEFSDTGNRVYINSFDWWFTPVAVVSYEYGILIKKTLDNLKEDYDNELRELKEHYRSKACAKFPPIGV